MLKNKLKQHMEETEMRIETIKEQTSEEMRKSKEQKTLNNKKPRDSVSKKTS